jgi:hypothetical protein
LRTPSSKGRTNSNCSRLISLGYGFLGFIPQNKRSDAEAAYICLDDCGRSRPKIVNRLLQASLP